MIESEQFEAMHDAFGKGDLSQLPRCAECFQHGGESRAFNTVLSTIQSLPDGAKDVVRKVIDLRYRS